MWEQLKNIVRKVGRRLGIIQHLKDVTDHKRINVDENEYYRINLNKRIYSGFVEEWHRLEYRGTAGRLIQRKQKSLGMAKVISQKLAGLMLNEGIKISLAEKSKSEQWDLISDVIESNKFKRELQRYVEYAMAMGGVAVEVYLDGDQPKLAYATADAFFPISQDTENIDEAVIANQFTKDGKVYTLLKWHEWESETYVVTNELYESNEYDEIGDKVPLSRLFPDMANKTHFNISHPLFIYIKPNIANNKHITSPLGLSVFDNAHDTLEILDTMYDFWYNEFRLGKRRVAVPQALVKTHTGIDGQVFQYLDDSEELFVALNDGEMDEFAVKDLTVDIRSEQIIESIQSLLDILSVQVGLSAGTFTFTPKGLKTATQVVSENSETYRTRKSHLSIVEDALRDLIVMIYEVVTLDDASGREPLQREDISIDFNDGIFQDNESKLQFYTKAVEAGFVPLKEAIMAIFGKSEEEAEEWLEIIQREKAQASASVEEAVSELLITGGRE